MSEHAFRCGYYLPGHDVHWIQAKVSARSDAPAPQPGHLLEVRADGLLIVESSGGLHRLWNHDPERLERLAKPNNSVLTYQPRFHLLRTSSTSGSFLFCVADAEHPARRPCPTHPPTGSLTELLREAGGFSLPGPEALRRWRQESSE